MRPTVHEFGREGIFDVRTVVCVHCAIEDALQLKRFLLEGTFYAGANPTTSELTTTMPAL
jgi:hypothetical protein